MKKENYLQLLREIKSVAFATVNEDGNPDVRVIDIMYIDHDRILFTTARGKPFYHQIMNQPNIAVTGMTKDYQMIKITGKVHKLPLMWMNTIIEHNPAIKLIYPNTSSEILEPFCIEQIEGTYFDLSEEPPRSTFFSFRDEEALSKRPYISEHCIACNLCAIHCPTNCISSGTTYKVDIHHCLNCGLCIEKCPVRAIQQKTVTLET